MHESTTSQPVLPGQTLQTEKMPGHWLLARLGKRVLRPGGVELTQRMLDALNVHSQDKVVEFAPGLGLTAKLVLQHRPATYTAIERDEAAANLVRRYLSGRQQRCLVGNAEQTNLPAESATVVYGEAMLTMQTPETKARIVGEAWRILEAGGRYGFHELCLVPDTLDERIKKKIALALLQAIHVGARPLTVSEWKSLVATAGFSVQAEATAPMHLLEPRRLLRDEGAIGALRFLWNVARDHEARRRVLAMRRTFRRYRVHLAAVMIVGPPGAMVQKPTVAYWAQCSLLPAGEIAGSGRCHWE
jgi:hypothetical protein